MRLYEWLTPEERRRFNFDVSRLNWPHYMHVHIAGVKKYILKLERAGTLEVDDDAGFGSHTGYGGTSIFDVSDPARPRLRSC